MITFEIRRLQAITGKQPFFELAAEGECQFEIYCQEIRRHNQYYPELLKIFTLMNLVAALKMLPKTKLRDITPVKENIKEYEFKSGHLRVYAFHLEKTGKIVAYGGYKNTQTADIVKFRSLKSRYIKSLQYDNKKRIIK